MSKNTAVEWLVDELRNHIAQGTLDAIAISEIKMQAKSMEREQIEEAFEKGYTCGHSNDLTIAISYYNETYK